MLISKDDKDLIIKVPLTQKQNNCYMDDDDLLDIPNICGYIETEEGQTRLGFSYVIDLSYKGATQYSGIFLEYSGLCMNPPIEEFTKLCKELGLSIVED